MSKIKYLAVIPARAGSKGIPKKNIKLLAGKPLIQYTIDIAKKIFNEKEICVSTDSQEVRTIAESLGIIVPFLRPIDLSGDKVSMGDVLNHVISSYKVKGISIESLVLLQPTSPFRTVQNVKNAIQLYEQEKNFIDMIVSVKITDANPYFKLFETDSNCYLSKIKSGNFSSRQDCPKVLEVNGAVYVIKVDSLLEKGMGNFDKIKAFEMSKDESVDIDDQLDWDFSEFLMQKKLSSIKN